MMEPGRSDIADAPLESPPDFNARIASLRSAGADRFDAARVRYIEALAKRAMAHRGSVRRVLDVKLEQTLAAFEQHFARARCEAKEILEQGAQHYAHAANDLQRLFDAGDLKGLRRLIATLKANEQCASLRALVRQLGPHAPENADTHSVENVAPRSELKALRNFRNTWAKLSVDNQVAQALKQAPKNAGPINSHMLVLRSLELMRDISPDYLNRFMSYADTLLSLDQGESEKPVVLKKQPAGKAAKK